MKQLSKSRHQVRISRTNRAVSNHAATTGATSNRMDTLRYVAGGMAPQTCKANATQDDRTLATRNLEPKYALASYQSVSLLRVARVR